MPADLIREETGSSAKGKVNRWMFKQADERQAKIRETREDRGSRYAGIRYTHYRYGLFFYTTRAFIHETTCATDSPSWNTSALGLQTDAEELG